MGTPVVKDGRIATAAECAVRGCRHSIVHGSIAALFRADGVAARQNKIGRLFLLAAPFS